VGVTRAFFYAGARRLVASLWDVDDQSTAALMESFYRKLQAGTAPAWALRDAKREVARSVRPAHRFPYYWASFVMVGSSTPSRAGPAPRSASQAQETSGSSRAGLAKK
jgi:CHAT domain-containing protein